MSRLTRFDGPVHVALPHAMPRGHLLDRVHLRHATRRERVHFAPQVRGRGGLGGQFRGGGDEQRDFAFDGRPPLEFSIYLGRATP